MKHKILFLTCCLFSLNYSLWCQAIVEVDGIDSAQITLNTTSFLNPTIVNFNSGNTSNGFSHYRLRNQGDVFRLDIESNLFLDTQDIFEITPSRFTIAHLSGTRTNLLGVSSNGTLVRLGSQTRQISLPAQALNFQIPNATISNNFEGINWGYSFTSSAKFTIAKPVDWDQVSDIVVTIYFATTSNAPGDIQFFGRHRDFNIGDPINDAPTVTSNIVSNSGDDELHKVSISFSASSLVKELWMITLQRNTGASLGYQDDVVVFNVTVEYEADI